MSFSTSCGGREECLPLTSPPSFSRSWSKLANRAFNTPLLRVKAGHLQKISLARNLPFPDTQIIFVLPRMIRESSAQFYEIDLVQRCLQGEESAIRTLQAEHTSYLKSVLFSYGATESESDDALGSLWADCVVSSSDRAALFELYNGESSLRSWLTAIVVNRWISYRRHRKVCVRAHEQISQSIKIERDYRDSLVDPELLAALEKALREACAACGAEEIVMLQLVHLHGLTQREIATIWGWHESRVSRFLSRAEEQIAQSTLRTIEEFDPELNLKWSDFLRLCECTSLLVS